MGQNALITQTQQMMLTLGCNLGTAGADGVWGNTSQVALNTLLSKTVDASKPLGVSKVAWGKKLSAPALTRLAQMVKDLRCAPEMIHCFMGCMAWETGEAFSPSTVNKVSGATGLIQFMSSTAKGLGTSLPKLAAMSVVEQLDYVYAHFKPFAGRLNNLGDVYMAILWPVGVGKPDDYVLWDSKSQATTFAQNAGLDVNADGVITRAETIMKVRNLLVKGFLPQYVA